MSTKSRTETTTFAAAARKIRQLERDVARLQMELDSSCNAEELRQVRAENAALRAALRECLDGIDYTVRVDAILRPEERHIGLESLTRHRSLLPTVKDEPRP